MRRLLLALIAMAFILPATAQKNAKLKAADTLIYTTVEHDPEFPGGMGKFLSYLTKNIKYPKKDDSEDFQGTFVIQMIVEKDGSITNVKELKRVPNTSMGKEIIKVVKVSPKWNPGIQNNHPVRVRYLIPIHF